MRSAPSVDERAPASWLSERRTRRLAAESSMVLASHTVQVTTDAIASPIITACTTGSALTNMPHGDRSRGSVAVPITGAVCGRILREGAVAAQQDERAGEHGRGAGCDRPRVEIWSNGLPRRISPRLGPTPPHYHQKRGCDVIM